MSDWDASDHEETTAAPLPVNVATAIKKNKWADEDADEDVKDDWEASDDDSGAEKKPADTKPKGPIRNKGVTKMKIAEKEAEEASRLAQLEALAEEEANPALRKKKEQSRTIEADMENARGLFGDAVISSATNSQDPLKMAPKTKDEFEEMSTALADLIVSKHGNKPLYPLFIEHFVRQLAAPLSDGQTRKTATVLTTLSNEKQRLAKENKKGGAKGKVKPTLGGGGGPSTAKAKGGRGVNADLEAYDQALDDDFDDFM